MELRKKDTQREARIVRLEKVILELLDDDRETDIGAEISVIKRVEQEYESEKDSIWLPENKE